MSVRLIAGRAGSGKTTHCLNAVRAELAKSAIDGPRLVVLVPEQATLQIERALLEGGPRALGRCEVLGFRRLARLVLNSSGGQTPSVVTSLGRQMMVRRVIARRRDRLQRFKSIADRCGVPARLAETLEELIQESVSAADLRRVAEQAARESNPAAPSLADLAELYEAYAQQLGSQVDCEGLLECARHRLDAAVWPRGAMIWVDGYASFSRQQSLMIAALASRAAQMEIALLIDPDCACVRGERGADSLSVFTWTERTWSELVRLLNAEGIALEPPLCLTQSLPPRFAQAAPLAQLERSLFHTPVQTEELPTVPFAAMPTDVTTCVRVVQVADARCEVEAAVREIRRLTITTARPMRFRDVAIICRDIEPYHDLVSASLHANGIPFFIDRRHPTTHHPLVQFLRCTTRLHDSSRFADAIIGLLKTGLTTLDDSQADLLENHLLARDLRSAADWSGERWSAVLPGEDPASVVSVSDARQRLLVALGDCWPHTQAPAKTGREWAEQLLALTGRAGVRARLQRWGDAARARGEPGEATEHVQVWNDVIGLLEEFVGVLGGDVMPATEFADVLDAGLSGFTLGLVPPTLDQVLVGAINRSRQPPLKAVFLLGFVDGAFPLRPSEDAVLGDHERELLAAANVPVGVTQAGRLLDERLLAYVAVTRASERLWISFPAADAQGRPREPSPYLQHVLAALGDPPVESIDVASPAQVLRAASTPAEFCGALAGMLRDIDRTESPEPARHLQAVALYEVARRDSAVQPIMQSVFGALRETQRARLDQADVERLWPSPHATSVSRLEAFALCAFQHYARHGLRLRRRAMPQEDVLALGQLHHLMLEHVFNDLAARNRKLHEMPREELIACVERVRRDVLPAYAVNMGWGPQRLKRHQRQSGRELDAIIDAQRTWPTHPVVAAREVAFGSEEGGWPTLDIKTPQARTVSLVGKIDRIDVIQDGKNVLGIVYDYKRSASKQRLGLDEVFHGLALQLLAYLLVIREHGARLKLGSLTPAAALYAPLIAPLIRVSHPDEASEEDFQPYAGLNPRGVIDFQWAAELDRALAEPGGSRIYNVYRTKEGALGYVDRSDALPGEYFAALDAFIRAKLGELADRWLDGDIAAEPRRFRKRLPCSDCEFRSVCRFEIGSSPIMHLASMSRTDIMTKLADRSAT